MGEGPPPLYLATRTHGGADQIAEAGAPDRRSRPGEQRHGTRLLRSPRPPVLHRERRRRSAVGDRRFVDEGGDGPRHVCTLVTGSAPTLASAPLAAIWPSTSTARALTPAGSGGPPESPGAAACAKDRGGNTPRVGITPRQN